MTQDYVDTIHNYDKSSLLLKHGVFDTDTIIIGNGPAALFLSFLLHGNVPYYDAVSHGPHPDPVLHRKLSELPTASLYESLQSPEDVSYLTEHFPASHLSYSTQAQRINVLLDSLLRPNGDIDIDECKPRIRWVKDDKKRVKHLVLGAAPRAGGQWSENPVATSLDICTLSYADMLSLPSYTFFDHYRKLHGVDMPELTRPSRRDVSSYYAQYPQETGISSVMALGSYVYQVERTGNIGFLVRVLYSPEEAGQQQQPPVSYAIRCKHVVLASGLFTRVLSPPPHLQQIPEYCASQARENVSKPPVLVVGSGFTAADILLSADPTQKVLHIFKWDQYGSSPLKGCHPAAYPEYAQIYKKMKLAAIKSSTIKSELSDQPLYEGFSNAEVLSVIPHPTSPGLFRLELKLPDNAAPVIRDVGCLAYFIGRRGDLSYLSPQIQAELGISGISRCISGDTLRARVSANVEVTPGVFAIGSLTGDSLVKFGFGSGVYSCGRIFADLSTVPAVGLDKSLRFGLHQSTSDAVSHEVDNLPEAETETPFSLPSLASSSSSLSPASSSSGNTVSTRIARAVFPPPSDMGLIASGKEEHRHNNNRNRGRKMSTCSTLSVASSSFSVSSAYRASKDSTCIIS